MCVHAQSCSLSTFDVRTVHARAVVWCAGVPHCESMATLLYRIFSHCVRTLPYFSLAAHLPSSSSRAQSQQQLPGEPVFTRPERCQAAAARFQQTDGRKLASAEHDSSSAPQRCVRTGERPRAPALGGRHWRQPQDLDGGQQHDAARHPAPGCQGQRDLGSVAKHCVWRPAEQGRCTTGSEEASPMLASVSAVNYWNSLSQKSAASLQITSKALRFRCVDGSVVAFRSAAPWHLADKAIWI